MTDPDVDRLALARLRERVQAAENAGDTAPIVELLADDAVLMVPDFPVQEGREACASFLDGLLPGLLTHFDRRITYASDEVAVEDARAIDRGTFSFTVQPRVGGARETVTGKYLWLYVRHPAGDWKLSRMIVSRDEAEDAGDGHAYRRGWAVVGLCAGAALLLIGVQIGQRFGDSSRSCSDTGARDTSDRHDS